MNNMMIPIFRVLRHLTLSSLSNRRVLTNLNLLNKLVNGFIDTPELLEEVNFKTTNFRNPPCYLNPTMFST